MTPTGRHRASTGAPASIWDFPEHGSRGPRPRHSRAAIAALAVRIADAEGLEAVTMRRLAGELGIGVMSLYNYVPAKDHLAQLMTDHLAAEYAYPSTPPADARTAIAELAGQARDIARRHPWLAGLLARPMPPGPNGLRYLDHFTGLLAGSRLDTGTRLEVIAMISGFATLYGARQAAPVGQLASPAEHVEALTRASARGRYPNLAATLATVSQPGSHADIFASCIERLIDLARLGLQRRGFPGPGDRHRSGTGAARALPADYARVKQMRSRFRCRVQTNSRPSGNNAAKDNRFRLWATGALSQDVQLCTVAGDHEQRCKDVRNGGSRVAVRALSARRPWPGGQGYAGCFCEVSGAGGQLLSCTGVAVISWT